MGGIFSRELTAEGIGADKTGFFGLVVEIRGIRDIDFGISVDGSHTFVGNYHYVTRDNIIEIFFIEYEIVI